MSLLAKTRTLNRLLQKAAGQAVNFKEMAEVLRDILQANVYVISRRGKILGSGINNLFQSQVTANMIHETKRIPEATNKLLLQMKETISNIVQSDAFGSDEKHIQELFEHTFVTVIPIIGGGNRIATLVLTRVEGEFIDDDLILAEYGSTIVGMEILRIRAEESEVEARSKASVQIAVGSLSFSELEAVEHIFEELQGKEGLLVASKIADRVGITRSVIVNALRKLESAGVIETRSLGMKGTYIKMLNEKLVQELENIRV